MIAVDRTRVYEVLRVHDVMTAAEIGAALGLHETQTLPVLGELNQMHADGHVHRQVPDGVAYWSAAA